MTNAEMEKLRIEIMQKLGTHLIETSKVSGVIATDGIMTVIREALESQSADLPPDKCEASGPLDTKEPPAQGLNVEPEQPKER
jgi:hypothetical protein